MNDHLRAKAIEGSTYGTFLLLSSSVTDAIDSRIADVV